MNRKPLPAYLPAESVRNVVKTTISKPINPSMKMFAILVEAG